VKQILRTTFRKGNLCRLRSSGVFWRVASARGKYLTIDALGKYQGLMTLTAGVPKTRASELLIHEYNFTDEDRRDLSNGC